MSEQDSVQTTSLQRPINNNKETWKAYWIDQGQPWRTEPEIDEERQKYLAELRKIEVDLLKAILPFEGIKLTRADVEWLLATHEDSRGPIDWQDESQHEREGLNLFRVDLRGEDLGYLPLAKICLRHAQLKKAYFMEAQLQEADLSGAQLQEAVLALANLQEADLSGAQLEKTEMGNAKLWGVNLFMAELQGTNLSSVHLAYEDGVGPLLADVQWGNTNLAVVDWSQITTLGDEYVAPLRDRWNWEEEDKYNYQQGYKRAARAYRQLAVALRNQGLNEDASRFAYRAQLMQRKVFWYQRKFLSYLGSLFLDLLSGYGYKVVRCFIAYTLVIGIFATIYHLLGTHPAWNEAIVVSMTAFHGRGFFPEQFHPGDPQALAAAIEAFVGLLIEITLIATLTQRFFGK